MSQKYRMYIDEVGNPDLESSENPNHRFLSLTGIIIELNYVDKCLRPQMEKLKSDFFHSHPDEPVVLHRKEIMNGRYPFHALRDTFVREKFDNEFLYLLNEWEYSVITVCIDKKHHKDTYSTWRYHPYHYCLAILLERYVFYLEQNNVVGDVMAESRGGREDVKLKQSFAKLFETGTDFIEADRIREVLTSRQLKVKQKSNNIAGLQLADILAHPSRLEILQERQLLNRDVPPFANKIWEVLKNKYYSRYNKVEGYGKKFL